MTDHKPVTESKEAKEPKPARKAKRNSFGALSVDPNQLIELVAKELQSLPEIKPPEWAAFVKTGMHKERPPAQKDWWHVRAAAVLRTVARLGPVGTSKLRTKFGGKQSRGYKPERFAPGSGSIIRKILQQLEKAGLIKQVAKGVHKGRIITKKASSMMEALALKVTREAKKETSVTSVKATHSDSVHSEATLATHSASPLTPTTPAGPAGEEKGKIEGKVNIQQASQAAAAAKGKAKA